MKLRMPRPLTLALLTAVLVLEALGLHFGMPIYRQQRAIREIERRGGVVYTSERGPDWLRQWLSVDVRNAFSQAYDVTIYEKDFDDLNARHIAELTGLESLILAKCPITDAGLVNLSGLRRLEYLEIFRTQITDKGLTHLRGLTNLRHLGVPGAEFTDAGVEHLLFLEGLESLDLSATDVTDAGIPLLKRLPNLKELLLLRTDVSDRGVEELKRAMPGLRVTR
jgi:hypothetical protein